MGACSGLFLDVLILLSCLLRRMAPEVVICETDKDSPYDYKVRFTFVVDSWSIKWCCTMMD